MVLLLSLNMFLNVVLLCRIDSHDLLHVKDEGGTCEEAMPVVPLWGWICNVLLIFLYAARLSPIQECHR